MQPTHFTRLQLELLNVYAHEPSDAELRDIQQMLARYYADKAHAAMDIFLAMSGVPPEETYKAWSKEDTHTPLPSELHKLPLHERNAILQTQVTSASPLYAANPELIADGSDDVNVY